MSSFTFRDFLKNITCQSDCCKDSNVNTNGNNNKIELTITTHPEIIHVKDEETQRTPDTPTK